MLELTRSYCRPTYSWSNYTARKKWHIFFPIITFNGSISLADQPNFGGLWETALKSLKSLLHKITGTATFTYEELSTLLTQIEATLNSRPLSPIETLPEDGISVLMPGHFLIGRPLSALPLITSSTGKTSTLRRWNFMQRLSDEFWDRSGEYIQNLTKFTKWLTPHKNVVVGDIVLYKDLPEIRPHAWPIARITKTVSGHDGCVPVVELQTGEKIYQRLVRKIFFLFTPPSMVLPRWDRTTAERVERACTVSPMHSLTDSPTHR